MSSYVIPGMRITDHRVTVPLDWAGVGNDQVIEVFAREVCDPTRVGDDLPILVFLQGGPGGKAPRPMPGDGWIADALSTHRVLLLDQRGTGRSTRVQAASLQGMDGAEAARYLLNFRADSIVRDLEHLRCTAFQGVRWQTLGQSYGGFITLTYLSQAPEGLSGCYIAGGLPGIDADADEVYERAYPRVAAKNEQYYQRYPDDAELISTIADYIDDNEILLPDGQRLSTRRLQTLGLDFGMLQGFERTHWLFDDAFGGPNQSRACLSDSFLAQLAARTDFDDNPLFAVMQESIYSNKPKATAWAAHQLRPRHPRFDSLNRPLFFTGEMMYPWMFEEFRSLRPFRAAAEAIAAYTDYAPLYDPERLADNEVPVSAIAYFDDMYVDSSASVDTAHRMGNCRLWITNEYEHDGIRTDAGLVRRLIDLSQEMGGARR